MRTCRYVVNPRLVRGLDYYSRTTFEAISKAVGAQSAVVAGGRYDGLVEALGGAAVAGTGFAIGVERIALALATSRFKLDGAPDAAIIAMGDRAADQRQWPRQDAAYKGSARRDALSRARAESPAAARR